MRPRSCYVISLVICSRKRFSTYKRYVCNLGQSDFDLFLVLTQIESVIIFGMHVDLLKHRNDKAIQPIWRSQVTFLYVTSTLIILFEQRRLKPSCNTIRILMQGNKVMRCNMWQRSLCHISVASGKLPSTSKQ